MLNFCHFGVHAVVVDLHFGVLWVWFRLVGLGVVVWVCVGIAWFLGCACGFDGSLRLAALVGLV